MEYLYIDESGTMTTDYCKTHPYFIISIVRTLNTDKLKTAYKRFISKNMGELLRSDSKGLMFKDSRFIELKGSCLTPQLKRKFIDFFCRNHYFEIFFILADNTHIQPRFYSNTARAFNYLIRSAMEYYIHHQLISDSGLLLQLDERNERTETKHFLENYLNTELGSRNIIKNDCTVRYFDSANNKIIQIADVFSNLYFSQLKTNAYSREFDYMIKEGYLKHIFRFPNVRGG